jgi:hypothetical protein
MLRVHMPSEPYVSLVPNLAYVSWAGGEGHQKKKIGKKWNEKWRGWLHLFHDASFTFRERNVATRLVVDKLDLDLTSATLFVCRLLRTSFVVIVTFIVVTILMLKVDNWLGCEVRSTVRVGGP